VHRNGSVWGLTAAGNLFFANDVPINAALARNLRTGDKTGLNQ
jgi:hypothetical protein